MSKNIVPCGGFELDDTLAIDKNGKLGISDIVVFKLDGMGDITANMEVSSIFDIIEKSNNGVRFILFAKDAESNSMSCAIANSYVSIFGSGDGLTCYVVFTLVYGKGTVQQLEVKLNKKENTITVI